jgi:ABC-type spermidine/putrescine transport system permease subunit I
MAGPQPARPSSVREVSEGPTVHQQTDPRLRVAMRALVVLLLLLAFLAAAAAAILCRRCRKTSGRFVGLANFVAYARTPALLDSLWNSLWVSALVTVIVIPLAFAFAYALRAAACASSRCSAASRCCRCWRPSCCRPSR